MLVLFTGERAVLHCIPIALKVRERHAAAQLSRRSREFPFRAVSSSSKSSDAVHYLAKFIDLS